MNKELKNQISHLKKEFKPIQEISDLIYPLTIVRDRYNGTYSGGKYLAWNIDSDDIPFEIIGNDTICSQFWRSDKVKYKYIVGKGDTIITAIYDLYNKLKKEEMLYV